VTEHTVVAASPGVWRGVRASATAFVEDIGRYALANTVYVLLLAATLTLSRQQPAGMLLAIAAVPLTGGIGRMTTRSVRGEHPRWSDFRVGLTHRCPTTWGLGAATIGVLILAALNVVVASARGGAWLVLSAVLSVHIGVAALAVVAATWPLLMDPNHDNQSSRTVIREALVVLALSARSIATVLLVEAVLVAVHITVLATAFVLPSVMVMVPGFIVLPRSDQIAPAGDRTEIGVTASSCSSSRA
jgi:hypothetical protein